MKIICLSGCKQQALCWLQRRAVQPHRLQRTQEQATHTWTFCEARVCVLDVRNIQMKCEEFYRLDASHNTAHDMKESIVGNCFLQLLLSSLLSSIATFWWTVRTREMFLFRQLCCSEWLTCIVVSVCAGTFLCAIYSLFRPR